MSAVPAWASIMAVKMGFRAWANPPEVTSSVYSPWSTPIRQETPIAFCATTAAVNAAAVSSRSLHTPGPAFQFCGGPLT
jgi:hypothetical protein